MEALKVKTMIKNKSNNILDLTDQQNSLLKASESLLSPHIDEDIDYENTDKDQIKYYYQNILYDVKNILDEVKAKTFDIDSLAGEISSYMLENHEINSNKETM